nr:galactosylgalactosylxylosylprotein 3-beta-glucuronosyltransferase 1-like [Ciona intestinalis]|eukprot:XP_002120380.2 galactosylgalactosylxylosylprotein 3-beta-glucuronosyltransferase 1-like [Ciona intestinalis]
MQYHKVKRWFLAIALIVFGLFLCQTFFTLYHFYTTKPQKAKAYCNTKPPFQVETIKEDMPIIYGLTSTYKRYLQLPELTRLSQTLLHIPKFHWILTEDSYQKTKTVTKFLQKSGLNYTHLNTKNNIPPTKFIKDYNTRRMGLNWIRENVPPTKDAIVYFIDDDNTYSLKLFDEIRATKRAAVWQVGLVGGILNEGPVRCENGMALEWKAYWWPDRLIPIDMAGFALHVKLLFERPEAEFRDLPDMESDFLSSLCVTRDNIEANNCNDVLVWHTQTKTPEVEE